jgi:hypothetical protein
MWQDPDFKDYHERLESILNSLKATFQDSDISDAFEAGQESRKSREQHEGNDIDEERRKVAHDRQARIMEEYSKAQNNFAENYADLYGEVTSDDEYEDEDVGGSQGTSW